MPTQTSSPALPMEQLYNTLMFDIEPDLVTYMIPALPVLYTDETPEEKAARSERYAKAFEKYEEVFGRVMRTWKANVLGYRNKVMKFYKTKVGTQEKETMSTLEDSIAAS